jgi:hypothetical protein
MHKWTRFAVLSVAARFEEKFDENLSPMKFEEKEEITKSKAMLMTEESKDRILRHVESLGAINDDEDADENFSLLRRRASQKAKDLL